MHIEYSAKDARKLEDMSEQEQHEEFQRLLNDSEMGPRLQEFMNQLGAASIRMRGIVTQTCTKIWAQFAQPGNVAFDLYCIRGPVSGVSDEQRVQAAERTVAKLSYLIDYHRWGWIREALQSQDSRAKSYIKDRARSLIYLAAYDLFQDSEFLHMPVNEGWDYALRIFIPRKVNNLLTEDVLGPEWRRRYGKNKYDKTSEIPFDEDEGEEYLVRAKCDIAEFEALLDIRQRVARSNLTPRQLELVRALETTGGVLIDAVKIIGIKEGTGKAQLSRIREKCNIVNGK